MSLGTIFILLLVVGGFLAMMRMHRGGGHGGHAGGHGCGGHGGHSHGDDAQRGQTSDDREAKDAEKPVLGKPGPQHHEHEHVTGGTRPV